MDRSSGSLVVVVMALVGLSSVKAFHGVPGGAAFPTGTGSFSVANPQPTMIRFASPGTQSSSAFSFALYQSIQTQSLHDVAQRKRTYDDNACSWRSVWDTSRWTSRPDDDNTKDNRATTAIADAITARLFASSTTALPAILSALDRVVSTTGRAVAATAWLLPLVVLCGVPVYTHWAFGTWPATPVRWKLVAMEAAHQHAHVVPIVAAFLASNVSYFATAAYLIRRGDGSDNGEESLTDGETTMTNTTPLSSRGMGLWLGTAGAVSTLFHSVQALGDYTVAEALCYVDHGVALTAGLYFLKRAGWPSIRTWGYGGAGLVALAAPAGPGGAIYTVLHSVWHVLSAAAAVQWVRDAARRSNDDRDVAPPVVVVAS